MQVLTFVYYLVILDSKYLQRWTKRWLWSVFLQTRLVKCFPNFFMFTLCLCEPLTPHKGLGDSIGTYVVAQHRSLSRTGWCIPFKYVRVNVCSLKEILIFMYISFVFQNNGSLAWCQNHKQCSKVSPVFSPSYLCYLAAFSLLSVD